MANRSSDSPSPSMVPERQRLAAACRASGLTLATLATRAEISETHMHCILRGDRRPGIALLATMRMILGDAAWHYACGRSDVLPAHPVAP